MAADRDETVVTAKDVMSKPVITVKENESVVKAAQLMQKRNIGGVIVVNKEDKPLGIITERDLATRVVAKSLQPNKILVSKIMSRPLATIDGGANIREVARKMSRLEIRRLAVVSNGELQGIITSKDILRITPALIDVLSEKSRLSAPEPIRATNKLAGYCDRCGVWSDALSQRDGDLCCDDCLSDIEEETKAH